MLPWIIGGAVVLAVGAIASDREEKAKKHYKNKLNKQHTKYSNDLQKRAKKNSLKKRSKLFKQIKKEQSALKEERKKLISIRNSMKYGSPERELIHSKIEKLTYLIEQKQLDADRVRL